MCLGYAFAARLSRCGKNGGCVREGGFGICVQRTTCSAMVLAVISNLYIYCTLI